MRYLSSDAVTWGKATCVAAAAWKTQCPQNSYEHNPAKIPPEITRCDPLPSIFATLEMHQRGKEAARAQTGNWTRVTNRDNTALLNEPNSLYAHFETY